MESYFIEMVGGGILAVLILKEVFGFITRFRTNGKNGKIDLHDMHIVIKDMKEDIEQIKLESRDMWLWHNKEDPDEPGVKVWYANRKRTEDALVKISEALDRQTEILNRMSINMEDLKK